MVRKCPGPSGTRVAAEHVLGSAPVRCVTRTVMVCWRSLDWLASRARARVLFPAASDLILHRSVEVKYARNVRLGQCVVIGPECTIGAAAEITLGDNARLSKRVTLETAGLDFSGQPPYSHITRPIRIGKGVWIGTGAIVL